jgi:hypothetical protein
VCGIPETTASALGKAFSLFDYAATGKDCERQGEIHIERPVCSSSQRKCGLPLADRLYRSLDAEMSYF